MSERAKPSPLPIDEALPRLRAALARHPTVVLQAPPGAGKTTRVPLDLLDAPWLAGQRILMLEPRRLAARAAAQRMAQTLNEPPGLTIGYQIRFERRASASTRVEVLTEGILARRLQSDPELQGVGLVIFDEFHERHLHSDLALALCRDVQLGLREDLRILVMSATLDGQAVARLLGDAPIVTSAGRSHPVTVHHLSAAAQTPLPQAMAAAIAQALERHGGDLLAFLPGAGEIRRTQALLEARLDPAVFQVCPLYGDLPQAEQDRALQPGPRRRVVLATNIAETSLTIEGITVVVDGGWSRQAQFDPGTGMSRLATVRVSQAAAEQRAGRAGRLGPGTCYRLWSLDAHAGLLPQATPEIRSADLAPLLLDLCHWGVADPASLTWLDPPPAAALGQARQLLQSLAALDAEGRITPLGRRMAALPLHPRLAHMLVRAQELDLAAPACDLAALLSERDLFARDAAGDLHGRLEALHDWRRRGNAAAQAWGAEAAACRRVDAAAAQYRRLLGLDGAPEAVPEPAQVGLLAALAYPDRIGQRREPGGDRYLLAQGRGARLSGRSSRQRPPWLVAAQLDAGQGEALIHVAQPVTSELLRRHWADRIQLRERVDWDAQTQQIQAQREERLGALVLSSQPLDNPPAQAVQAALLDGLRRLGAEALPWSPAARQLQARVRFLRQHLPEENWPDFSDEVLLATLADWLAPWLDGVRSLRALAQLDLHEILLSRLDWPQRVRLDEGAPTHLVVPSGSRIRLDYEDEQAPVLAVKLQELFGLAETPRVAWNRVPVTLHLLSPARRPIQVTRDLKNFWERTYFEVRKELKGRYPKHPWPDDPWRAPPTRGTTRAAARDS